jgi:hypothetical protein
LFGGGGGGGFGFSSALAGNASITQKLPANSIAAKALFLISRVIIAGSHNYSKKFEADQHIFQWPQSSAASRFTAGDPRLADWPVWLRRRNGVKFAVFAEENSMSNKSKLAVITAASIGVVVTQSSSLRAEKENSSASEKVIAAPINADEDVFYSAIPDDALERAGLHLAYTTETGMYCNTYYCNKGQVKKPPTSQSKKQKQ